MKLILFIFISTILFPIVSQSAPKKERSQYYSENQAYQWLSQERSWSHHIQIVGSPEKLSRFGAMYRIQYSLGMSAIDLGVGHYKSNWQTVSNPLSEDERTNASFGSIPPEQSGSEYSRLRLDDDEWTQTQLEFGYSIRGRLIPLSAERFAQTARVALGYQLLNDQVNSLNFTGVSFSAEAGVLYLMSPAWLIGPTLGYRFGSVHSSAGSGNINHIPLNQFEMGLSFLFKI